MNTEARVTVAVAPAEAFDERPRLFAALEQALPVRFVPIRSAGGTPAALIALVSDPAAPLPEEWCRPEVPVLSLGRAAGAEEWEDVMLSDAESVDRRVRGIQLRDRPVGGIPGGTQVLAAAASGAVWTRSEGGTVMERVRCMLPELGEDEVLYKLLSQRAIASVALLQFLRTACAEVDWRAPRLRAAFVFDDPNLRWHSYGFVDYRRLVEEADRHGYHAAMAMIPLDATRPHRPTVALFAARRDRLSLVFHGNDHLRDELLMPSDGSAALSLAAQSVRRIERFERRTGLTVDRIMMPPHGLCSEPVMRALARLGFDALSAIHPLPWTAERPTSPLMAAWRPSEFIAGCPVIPRMAITSTDADIALRALLDHPLIIYGHHEDVAGGLDLLAETARRVNRLGDVDWMSVKEIALTNYACRVQGRQMVVRPYANRLRITIPSGVEQIVVAAPESSRGPLELTGWSAPGAPMVPFGSPAAVNGASPVEVRLHVTAALGPADVAAPAWRPWPRLRRAVAESRDRALPLRALLSR